MSGITQGYTDANIAIFGLSAKIKADFVGGAGDKVLRDFNDFNDPNDFKVFNAPDAIKKIAENFAGGGILLTLYPEGIFVDRSRLLGAFLHRYGCFRKTNTTFSISRGQSRTCSGYAEARKGIYKQTLKLIIIVKKPLYFAPAVRECALVIERGFAASGGFEQPEYGGEDDL